MIAPALLNPAVRAPSARELPSRLREGPGEGLSPSPQRTPAKVSPGQYLGRRRRAAGITLDQAVSGLLALPEARLTASAIGREARLALAARLVDAEADNGFLAPAHAELVARVFAFDPAIYAALFAAANAFYPVSAAMCIPHLCPSCACSWCDPCFTADANGNPGTCSWSTTSPGLCTACEAEGL